jgi:hypothetical protein
VPNVEWKTPDDGQMNCPKHVEFLDKINLENYCFYGFIKKETLKCLKKVVQICKKTSSSEINHRVYNQFSEYGWRRINHWVRMILGKSRTWIIVVLGKSNTSFILEMDPFSKQRFSYWMFVELNLLVRYAVITILGNAADTKTPRRMPKGRCTGTPSVKPLLPCF